MHYLDPEDQELGDDIAPDVLRVLNNRRFFEALEIAVFPGGDSGPRQCEHSFVRTEALLIRLGFSEDEREDILVVFKSHGGFCDCEVLYNVDDREDSPKSRYWRTKATALEKAG